MARPERGAAGQDPGDGVRRIRRPGGARTGGLVALAIALVAVVVISVWPRDRSPGPPVPGDGGRPPDAFSGDPRGPSSAAVAPAPPLRGPGGSLEAVQAGLPPASGGGSGGPRLRPGEDRPPPGSDLPVPEPEVPGPRTGVGVFPPPGTDPPKPGILVPEGFELPPGYVRHYQATDTGERLPAILMFSPDFEWVDPDGNAVPLPSDLVVPPEMAPPGMPIEILEPPDTPIDRIEDPPAKKRTRIDAP